MKSPIGWKNGSKLAAVFVVMGLIFVGLNNGTMKGMNGQEISLFAGGEEALSRIEPAAGDVYASGSSSSSEEGAGVSEPYDFGDSGVSESPPYTGEEDDGISYEDSLLLEDPVQQDSCGNYDSWVGKKVDERAVKATGKPYRILRPNTPVTEDYSPQRINVIVNDRDIVIEVKCG